MAEPSRSRDDGTHLYPYADEVLVVCPRCAGRAVVVADGPGGFTGPRKVVCSCCGLAQRRSGESSVWGTPIDPWFRCDLWLTAAFRGHVLWAYNARHAQRLRDLVAADLRERSPTPAPTSFLEKMPRWFKAASNRAALIKLLDEMIARAS